MRAQVSVSTFVVTTSSQALMSQGYWQEVSTPLNVIKIVTLFEVEVRTSQRLTVLQRCRPTKVVVHLINLNSLASYYLHISELE